MKKRTAFIGAILSLMPLGQPLLIKTGVILSSSAMMVSLPEKVNAQTIKLNCDVKTHVQKWKGEIWKNIKNMNWDLEVNQINKIVVKRETVFYEGRNYDLVYYFNIMNDRNNKIVAFRKEGMDTTNGGLASTTMTLDLNSMKISTANHMQDNRGYSFSLHYGRCLQK